MKCRLHRKRRAKKLIRGLTTVEVLTAATMTTLVLMTSVLALLSGLSSWAQGQGKINAESQSQQVMRRISAELREAMSVTVDEDGLGLSYRLPKRDNNGDIIAPVEWDTVERRIDYNAGELVISRDNEDEVLSSHMTLRDPTAPENAPDIKVFAKGSGTITRQLTVTLAMKYSGNRQEEVASRTRETLYLRNIPSLTR